MMDYAMYRLPYQKQAYRIDATATRVLSSAACLNDAKGFVMAPFCPTPQTPTIIVEGEAKHADIDNRALNVATSGVVETTDRKSYSRDFAVFHEAICKGEFAKLVLSRCAELSSPAEPLCAEELFAEACRRYPRMMIALVSSDIIGTWLMATPEILIAKDNDKWHTMALAGTMQYAGTMDCKWSAKNIEEQQMVARYIEDTLKPLAEDIEVSSPYTVRAGNLVHLRSDFTFKLGNTKTANYGIGDVVNTLHPTPAVCGLPKNEAARFILANETTDRKYYSGYCGPWNVGGTSSLFVSLRCMEINGSKATMYAGGGLLRDSDEDSEWQETMIKMEAMRKLCTQTR